VGDQRDDLVEAETEKLLSPLKLSLSRPATVFARCTIKWPMSTQ